MQYLIAICLGVLSGALAVFFTQGGIRNYRLFLRLTRRRGGWTRARWGMVALAVAVSLYGAWLYGGITRPYMGFLLLTCYLQSVAVTDWRKHAIPDDATLFFAAALLLYQVTALDAAQLLFAAIGAAAGCVLLGLPHLLRPSSVGLGDVKLLAVCGLATGFPGILYILIRGMVFMAVFSLIQLFLKRKTRSSEVPLAPFLLLGALI